MQKSKLADTLFLLFTNINSTGVIDLSIKCKNIKLLGGNRGENLDDLGYGDDF